MTENWGLDVVRSIFAQIDRAVYTLISVTYELLLELSQTIIFTQENIQEFQGRIYTLLGVFMLFKVTFSFINYIVNPDQMNDKAKGVHKIITNIVLVLALIIITPTAFQKLVELQNAILKDNIIPKFILGTTGNIGTDKSFKMSEKCEREVKVENDGDYISLIVFRPFYQVEEITTSLDINSYIPYYCTEMAANTTSYLNAEIYNKAPGNWNGTYLVNYSFFLSTIVGIVVALILVSFCFDVAIRSIKLGFLQLIAPVPIISYIDPDSSKNGMFKKWLKEVGKTWADLFIRLIALFFAIYVITMVTSAGELSDISLNPLKNKFWIDLFIIIGALMFAKKLPSLIESITGIKIDGGLTLNPMKKIRDNALGGKMITGGLKAAGALGVGAVLGMGANAYKIGSDWKKEGLKKALIGDKKGGAAIRKGAGTLLGAVASAGAGGISSALRGAQGSLKNDSFKKGVGSGLQQSVKNRDVRDKREKAGYKDTTRWLDTLRGAAGVDTVAKGRSIEIGNQIANTQMQQTNLGYNMREFANQINLATKQMTDIATVNKDKDGNYSFKNDKGKAIEWDGKTSFDEKQLDQLLKGGALGGQKVDPVQLDDVKKYIGMMVDNNNFTKIIGTAGKDQSLFQKEDSTKKKS